MENDGMGLTIAILALLFLFVWIPALIASWVGLSILWMPIGLLTSAFMARVKGLSVGRYAVMGALFSTFMFVPWVYLMIWMWRRKVPEPLTGMGILSAYVVWPYMTLYLAVGLVYDLHSGYWFLLLGSMAAWLASIVHLMRYGVDRVLSWESADNSLPHPALVMPFAMATVVASLSLVAVIGFKEAFITLPMAIPREIQFLWDLGAG